MRGSLVNLYNFDNSTNKGSDKGTDKGAVIAVRPSLNSINNKKQSKPNKQERVKSKFSPPSIDQVKNFFLEINSTVVEAEKFHNHFESNGWLVGGKAKMKNWEAAARNWIKRADSFNPKQGSLSAVEGRLHTNDDKDYATPL
ncbi:MAG: hypothetical protein R2780_11890 [Crocinitomicaceae bacterium]